MKDSSFERVEEMTSKELVDKVRSRLIEELEGFLAASTHYGTTEWVNETTCRNLIADLKEKRATTISGSVWGDFLDGVLYEENIRHPDLRYAEIRQMLEEGK